MHRKSSAENLLAIRDVVGGYGKKQVLNGISLQVAEGEIVAIIGHNGSGKSTLLKAIFGLAHISEGVVSFDGESIRGVNPGHLLRLGIAYVPQGNRVFGDLTVAESLRLASLLLADKKAAQDSIERCLVLFPKLRDRGKQRARALSGGEKQQLALASALVQQPRLLLLDEPSTGLSPALVAESFEHIENLSKSVSVATLIVEQKVREVLKIARRVYVFRGGLVSFTGPATDLADEEMLKSVYI